MNERPSANDEFRRIFDEAPVSLWVEDLSDIKKFIDRLRISGVDKLRAYFENHPEAVGACAKMVKVIQVNKATLDLYKADSEEQILAGIDKTFTEESYEVFKEELIALVEGRGSVASEAVTKTLTGAPVHILIRISIMPGYEDTWHRVLVSMNDISERKRAEDSLKSSEQKYRTLVENVNDAILLADVETGFILDVNHQAEVLTGLPREALVGMHQSALHPEGEAEKYREAFQSHIRMGGGIFPEVMQVKHRDGRNIPVEISAGLITIDGKVMILGVFRDVTARQAAERALQESESQAHAMAERLKDSELRFRTLAEASSVGIFVFRDQIIYANPAFEELWGYTLDELKHLEISDLIAPELAEEVLQRWQDRKQGKATPSYYEIKLKRKDGQTRWGYLASGLAEYDGRNASIGTVIDITGCKWAKEQLRRANRTLRMLSDCNQALVRVSDEQQLLETICTLIVDEGGYKMAWVGEAKHDDERRVIPLAQAGFEEGYFESVHISWADNPFGRGPSGRAIREGHYVVCQDILYDPAFLPWRDQAIRQGYASSIAFPLTVNGRVTGILNIYASESDAFYADEMKLLEELAGDLAFGIEVLRNRRAKDALEEQFVQAQKMEAIGTLTGGIAHDFNNMLAGMLGTVYLVRDTLTDHPEAQKKLRRVEKTGFRAAEMISQLLTFARKGMTDMQPVALTSFLKEAFKLARSSVPENIGFTLDVPETECTVKGDATLLQQALLNLVTNARHAVAGQARPAIHISLNILEANETLWKRYPDLPRKPYVQLTVEDNGCGIPGEDLNKLFDPFFTTKGVGEGTGLGLAMVYGAVQSHNGVIEVKSKEEEGSEFRIFLPLIEQIGAHSRLEEDQALVEGHGETILLADDEKLVCEISRELLEFMGFRVLIAGDGEEAVRIFEEHQDEIRLAILDVVMPRMGGVDAAFRIRASDPELPIVFQTGYGEEQVLGEIKNLKYCRVLIKPAPAPEISRTLRELLESGS